MSSISEHVALPLYYYLYSPGSNIDKTCRGLSAKCSFAIIDKGAPWQPSNASHATAHACFEMLTRIKEKKTVDKNGGDSGLDIKRFITSLNRLRGNMSD